jgi:hypothetical protein
LTLIGVGWGVKYDWPDFVHVDYGFPAKWATHTLITFTGPADQWAVNPAMLLIDIALWQTILIVGIIILEMKYFRNKG